MHRNQSYTLEQRNGFYYLVSQWIYNGEKPEKYRFWFPIGLDTNTHSYLDRYLGNEVMQYGYQKWRVTGSDIILTMSQDNDGKSFSDYRETIELKKKADIKYWEKHHRSYFS